MYPNPYGPNPQMMQQAAQAMQAMPAYGYQPPSTAIVKVTGIDGAKAYQLGPNSSIALFDDSNDVFYLKTTDGAGFPTIRTFTFAPVDTPAPGADYVSRAEFDRLASLVDSLRGGAENAQ